MTLKTIASFWVGAPLSFVELLVMQSFIDRGHPFVLYALDELGPLPNGVELRRFGALLVKEKPMFIRSVHGFNDSRVAASARWRKIDDWPTDAQIATRFPFLLQVSA